MLSSEVQKLLKTRQERTRKLSYSHTFLYKKLFLDKTLLKSYQWLKFMDGYLAEILMTRTDARIFLGCSSFLAGFPRYKDHDKGWILLRVQPKRIPQWVLTRGRPENSLGCMSSIILYTFSLLQWLTRLNVQGQQGSRESTPGCFRTFVPGEVRTKNAWIGLIFLAEKSMYSRVWGTFHWLILVVRVRKDTIFDLNCFKTRRKISCTRVEDRR